MHLKIPLEPTHWLVNIKRTDLSVKVFKKQTIFKLRAIRLCGTMSMSYSSLLFCVFDSFFSVCWFGSLAPVDCCCCYFIFLFFFHSCWFALDRISTVLSIEKPEINCMNQRIHLMTQEQQRWHSWKDDFVSRLVHIHSKYTYTHAKSVSSTHEPLPLTKSNQFTVVKTH